MDAVAKYIDPFVIFIEYLGYTPTVAVKPSAYDVTRLWSGFDGLPVSHAELSSLLRHQVAA
jgi:hypothetical protein